METREVEPAFSPLQNKRLELSRRLGAILADEARFQSPEYGQCVDEINEVSRLMRESGADTPDFLRVLASSQIATVVNRD